MIVLSQQGLSFVELANALQIGSTWKSHLPQDLVLGKEPRNFQTARTSPFLQLRPETWWADCPYDSLQLRQQNDLKIRYGSKVIKILNNKNHIPKKEPKPEADPLPKNDLLQCSS